jgi:hypothetical protein
MTTVFVLSFVLEIASTGQTVMQGASAHCLHVTGKLYGKVYFPSLKLITEILDLLGFISPSLMREHISSQLLQLVHLSGKIFSWFGMVLLDLWFFEFNDFLVNRQSETDS